MKYLTTNLSPYSLFLYTKEIEMRKFVMYFIVFIMMGLYVSSSYASTDIGKVRGDKTWIVYVGSGNGLFLRRGSSDFALKCDTGFVNKGKYVLGRDGSSYTTNSSVITAIQTRLVRGKYRSSGCY